MLENEQTKLAMLVAAAEAQRWADERAGPRASHRRARASSRPDSSRRPDRGDAAMEFFQTFWTWLNGELASYIGENTARVASILEPAVVTLGTVYVMIWGYLQLTGRIDEPFVAGVKRIVTLAVVFGVGAASVALQHAAGRHILQRADGICRGGGRCVRSGADHRCHLG